MHFCCFASKYLSLFIGICVVDEYWIVETIFCLLLFPWITIVQKIEHNQFEYINAKAWKEGNWNSAMRIISEFSKKYKVNMEITLIEEGKMQVL